MLSMDRDGETAVMLGSSHEVDPGRSPVFDGQLETPNRVITVSTVEGKAILMEAVPEITTHVRVWVNNLTMPYREYARLDGN